MKPLGDQLTKFSFDDKMVLTKFSFDDKLVKMKSRSLSKPIQDLALNRKKMAFISGPRQCGKTTLAKSLLVDRELYFNWDDHRFKAIWTKSPELIAERAFAQTKPRLVLDEFHKNRRWKTQVKAFYDHHGDNLEIILTGSAHLNAYRKGVDSLMGRFVHFHLLPFSLGELETKAPLAFEEFNSSILAGSWPESSRSSKSLVDSLWKFGGFPEPLLSQSEQVHNIWSRNRLELLVRQDLRDLSRILDLSQVEVLASLLPVRVGSPLSVQSLREDLDCAHTTLTRWLKGLSEVYYHFELKPYSTHVIRSLKKEGKIYLYDWSAIEDMGSRFENMVACHLLKICHYFKDIGESDLKLHYLRDKEKREVDFLVMAKNKPLFSVESKLNQLNLDRAYLQFQKRLKVPHFQIVKTPNICRRISEGPCPAYVVSFDRFFQQLP